MSQLSWEKAEGTHSLSKASYLIVILWLAQDKTKTRLHDASEPPNIPPPFFYKVITYISSRGGSGGLSDVTGLFKWRLIRETSPSSGFCSLQEKAEIAVDSNSNLEKNKKTKTEATGLWFCSSFTFTALYSIKANMQHCKFFILQISRIAVSVSFGSVIEYTRVCSSNIYLIYVDEAELG